MQGQCSCLGDQKREVIGGNNAVNRLGMSKGCNECLVRVLAALSLALPKGNFGAKHPRLQNVNIPATRMNALYRRYKKKENPLYALSDEFLMVK